MVDTRPWQYLTLWSSFIISAPKCTGVLNLHSVYVMDSFCICYRYCEGFFPQMFSIWFLSYFVFDQSFDIIAPELSHLCKDLIQPQYFLDIFYLVFSVYVLRNGAFGNIFSYIPFTSLKPHWMLARYNMLSLWLFFGAHLSASYTGYVDITSHDCMSWWMATLSSSNSWVISMFLCVCVYEP